MDYYHGGPRGLRKILPACFTGTKGQSYYGNMVADPHKVYVTASWEAACMYAAQFEKGSVYEVLPIGKVEHGPDCVVPGLSFMCDRANVVKEYRLKPSETKELRKALLHDLRFGIGNRPICGLAATALDVQSMRRGRVFLLVPHTYPGRGRTGI